jgi:photosystem II stability/assembly factor-like uncharacterized protein
MRKFLLFIFVVGIVCSSKQLNAQWIIANSGLTVQDANSFANIGTDLFVGTGNISGNGQGVFKSTNNGVSWTAVNSGLTNLNVQQLIIKGTTLFAAIGSSGPPDGGVFRSTDNGATWNPCNAGLTYAHAYNIAALGSTLYVSSIPSTVFKSTDNGDNWTAVTDPVLVNTRVKSIVTIGGNQLVASDLGSTAGVVISTDGGATWATTSITDETDDLQVIGSMVYAATSVGVFRSYDSGATWDTVAISTNNATALEAVDTMLIVGTPYGVYSTCDRGETFTDISVGAGGANLSIEAFGIDAANIYIGNTFHSVGVWSRALNELSCDPNAAIEGETQVGHFSVYPNPSNGIVNIANNSEVVETSIEVFSLTGVLVQRSINASQIDLTNQPNGMYIIKINEGETVFSSRIIKE